MCTILKKAHKIKEEPGTKLKFTTLHTKGVKTYIYKDSISKLNLSPIKMYHISMGIFRENEDSETNTHIL